MEKSQPHETGTSEESTNTVLECNPESRPAVPGQAAALCEDEHALIWVMHHIISDGASALSFSEL